MINYYVDTDVGAGGDGSVGSPWNKISVAEAALDDAPLSDDVTVHLFGTAPDTPVTITVDTNSHSLTWTGREGHAEGAHSGVWDDSKYTLDTGDDVGISLTAGYAGNAFKKFQVFSNPTSTYRYPFSIGDSCTLRDIIAKKGANTGGSTRCFKIGLGAGETALVQNCIAYGFHDTSDAGFYTDGDNGSVKVVNCVAIDCTVGFSTGYQDTKILNSVAFGCGDAFYGTWYTGSNYNLADTETPVGANSIDTAQAGTDLFEDYASSNFDVKDTDSDLYDNGAGPDTDADCPTLDIAGNSRSGSTCDIGAFEYVAAAATTLTAAQGSAAITGQAARLFWHHTMKAEQASVAATGQAARTQWHHSLKAEQGAVAISGQDATLTYIGGAPGVYTMTADQASVSITGQAANLLWHQTIKAAQGSASITGQAALLKITRTFKAEQASVVISGQAARLQWQHKVKAEQGSVAITTQASRLTWNRLLKAQAAALAITGSDIDFYASRLLRAEQATIAITGQAATLTYSGAPVLVAPAERTVKIAAESRLITIPGETACTVTIGAELVTNGDMAVDLNWTNSAVNPYDNFYHDFFFQAFFGDHAAATLAQAYSDPFSVTAGQTYRVTFSIFVITAPGPKIILAKDTSGTSIVPGVYQSWSGAGWQDHVVYFTPTESSASARFFLYNQEATDFRLDDVSVKPYDIDLIAGAEGGDFRLIKVGAENRTMII